ncbi:MAG: CRISPR-associated endonuclease Cas1 [Candidatus Firestonebacteria bacterium]|nr:CRISPR-associated endonuclease Cas1 [Candidatus Firestonebacteria bacterium]
MSILSHAVSVSSDIIKHCIDLKIPIDFLSYNGKPFATIMSPMSWTADIGIAQLEAYKNGKGINLAKNFVNGKIKNQINLIKYYNKYKKRKNCFSPDEFNNALNTIEKYLSELDDLNIKDEYDTIRNKIFSIEGRSAGIYWNFIKNVLSCNVEFNGRERKGAKDLVNSLLNYGYGILYSRVWNAINLAGLNPYISYLHTSQPNKPTLYPSKSGKTDFSNIDFKRKI